MSDIEAALSQVVSLGGADVIPHQTIALGEAVKQSISKHPARPIVNYRVSPEIVRALLDARNAIDAALAQLEER